MFYRRKIILALLQIFGNNLGKTPLQKLIFLVCQRQIKPDYYFVPYKFGAYSFSLKADLYAMEKHKQISISSKGVSNITDIDYVSQLKEKDKQLLLQINLLHKNKTNLDLIKFTYKNYPYFAINSTIKNRYLTVEENELINCFKPTSSRITLFTIGYEGISLEEYLNKLILNDIKTLVDVRNNPISMKYGFSKSELIITCNNLNIEYIHMPEMGIKSNQRQQLKNQEDYDKLFYTYKSNNLVKTRESQVKILNILKTHKRIALTCFEANICQCHRKHLAEAITKLPEFQYELKHI